MITQLVDAVLMLQCIAKAVGKQIEFRIVPLKAEPTQAELKPQPAIS